MRGFWKSLPVDYHTYALMALVFLSTVLVLMAKWMSRKQPTMTRKRKKLLLDQQEFVKSVVKAKKVCTCRVRNTYVVWLGKINYYLLLPNFRSFSQIFFLVKIHAMTSRKYKEFQTKKNSWNQISRNIFEYFISMKIIFLPSENILSKRFREIFEK